MFRLTKSGVSGICKNRLFWKKPSRRESSLSDFEIQQRTEKIIKYTPPPMALYGGRHAVTLIPGGGVGPECLGYVREVFKVIGAPVDFEVVEVGPLVDNVDLSDALTSIRRNCVGIKGHIPTHSDDVSAKLKNVAFRNDLDLYVYVLCFKSYAGVRARQKDVDIVIVRQNLEGEYSMLEHGVDTWMVENLKIHTRTNSLRVARFAFDYARKNKRKRVTTVHKANIMKLVDGLFLSVNKEVAKEYPEIEHDDMIIDNCCMQLVARPQQFDVLLTPNLYGNVVTGVVCGVIGGAGLYSGRNYGEHYAVFEPAIRSGASPIAGKNIANPVAMLNASVDLLFHLGHREYAKRIERAIVKTLVEDKIHTADLGGTATSQDVVRNVIDLCLA
ncbi:Iso dh domain containing protein [Asbolus verrucosus]|uniref:Iso dh domain containing protein n=1 Tax=Asbolus verrucosus TaxID=1661398 RepID=A0A482W4F9_ASBVE|nr:Iso dh domain containing protein [Asbolus verrucosus]